MRENKFKDQSCGSASQSESDKSSKNLDANLMLQLQKKDEQQLANFKPTYYSDYESRKLDICYFCGDKYNVGDKIPRIILQCGHTFCTSCLTEIHYDQKLRCPLCRKLLKGLPSVDQLPLNINILYEIVAKNPLIYDLNYDSEDYVVSHLCYNHQERIQHFYCQHHHSVFCRECIQTDHSNEQCFVVDLYEIQKMKRLHEQNIGMNMKQVKQNNLNKKDQIYVIKKPLEPDHKYYHNFTKKNEDNEQQMNQQEIQQMQLQQQQLLQQQYQQQQQQLLKQQQLQKQQQEDSSFIPVLDSNNQNFDNFDMTEENLLVLQQTPSVTQKQQDFKQQNHHQLHQDLQNQPQSQHQHLPVTDISDDMSNPKDGNQNPLDPSTELYNQDSSGSLDSQSNIQQHINSQTKNKQQEQEQQKSTNLQQSYIDSSSSSSDGRNKNDIENLSQEEIVQDIDDEDSHEEGEIQIGQVDINQ